MNGHSHLFGNSDYEDNYSEGFGGCRMPTWLRLGYDSLEHMKKRQQEYMARESVMSAIDDFEVIE